jgi:hypothetical protein
VWSTRLFLLPLTVQALASFPENIDYLVDVRPEVVGLVSAPDFTPDLLGVELVPKECLGDFRVGDSLLWNIVLASDLRKGVDPFVLVCSVGYGKFEAKASPFRAGMKPTNSIQPPTMA